MNFDLGNSPVPSDFDDDIYNDDNNDNDDDESDIDVNSCFNDDIDDVDSFDDHERSYTGCC